MSVSSSPSPSPPPADRDSLKGALRKAWTYYYPSNNYDLDMVHSYPKHPGAIWTALGFTIGLPLVLCLTRKTFGFLDPEPGCNICYNKHCTVIAWDFPSYLLVHPHDYFSPKRLYYAICRAFRRVRVAQLDQGRARPTAFLYNTYFPVEHTTELLNDLFIAYSYHRCAVVDARFFELTPRTASKLIFRNQDYGPITPKFLSDVARTPMPLAAPPFDFPLPHLEPEHLYPTHTPAQMHYLHSVTPQFLGHAWREHSALVHRHHFALLPLSRHLRHVLRMPMMPPMAPKKASWCPRAYTEVTTLQDAVAMFNATKMPKSAREAYLPMYWRNPAFVRPFPPSWSYNTGHLKGEEDKPPRDLLLARIHVLSFRPINTTRLAEAIRVLHEHDHRQSAKAAFRQLVRDEQLSQRGIILPLKITTPVVTHDPQANLYGQQFHTSQGSMTVQAPPQWTPPQPGPSAPNATTAMADPLPQPVPSAPKPIRKRKRKV